MEKIDFYLLPAGGVDAAEHIACRVTEKAHAQAQRVFIRTRDPEQAKRLDALLWTFRPDSFIPHALIEAAEPADTVLIGARLPDEASRQLLINLAGDLPTDWERFERLAEIVEQTPQALPPARERFRHYREHGITPDYHRLEAESSS